MNGADWMWAISRGAAAGAAGTTTLNAVTDLDMALRARPASSTPEDTVERLSGSAGVAIPGDEEQRGNRLAGLGPLSGILAGVGAGVVLGVLRAAGWRPPFVAGAAAASAVAWLAGNGPMVALGITDPRDWSLSDWASDLVPHVAFGVVTAAVLAAEG